jgi:hypothetical protein
MKYATYRFVFIMLLGCGGASPPAQTTAEDTSPPGTDLFAPASLEQHALGKAAVALGTWDNSSCGERKFRRRVIIEPSGRILGTDFIAPCPPQAQCVWSGIANWHGTWSETPNGLDVSLEPIAGDSPGSLALPVSFVIVTGDEPTLAERSGGLVCPYHRVR